MVPFVDGDQDYDFWKQNPEIKAITPFNELVNKKYGSEMMWVVYLMCDPKSKYHRYGKEKIKEELEETYVKGKFKISSLKSYIDAYPEKCLTETERFYIKWGDMLRDFDKHFDDIDFSKNLSDKLTMLRERDRVWKSYLDAEKSAKEELKYRVKGGREESILESGEIG